MTHVGTRAPSPSPHHTKSAHAFRSRWITFASALAIAAFAERAHASDTNVTTALDYVVSWMPNLPSRLGVSSPTDTAVRSVPAGNIRFGGSGVFSGGSAQLTLVNEDRWLIPLVGMQLAGAVGGSPSIVSSIDGSLISAQPWTAGYFAALLPGFGARFHNRRLLFQARAYTGVSVMWANAALFAGNSSTLITGFNASFLVRADFELCYRLDPTVGTCFFVAPTLFEYTPLNGGIAGLRMEFGP